MKNYLNTHQVAKKLGVNVQTVRHYIRKGELRAAKVGKRYVMTQEDINAFLERRKEVRDLSRLGLSDQGKGMVLKMRENSRRILAYLLECPGAAMDELSAALDMEADETLRALRRLEEEGLAHSEPCGAQADREKDPWFADARGIDEGALPSP